MKIVRINVETSFEAEDAVSYMFMEIGANGVQAEDIKSSDRVIISAYYPADDTIGERIFKLQESLNNIEKLIPNASKSKISMESLDDIDWADSWKSFFRPMLIGKRIVVYPSWEDVSNLSDRDIRILIDPGMAFGTGKHATTILSLELLEKVIKDKDEVADIGTGSGILAIASIKLGASKVIAVDIDSDSVEIAKDNSKINSVSDKINIICGDLTTAVDGKFDVLVSNIHTKVLLTMIPNIKNYLKPSGYVILSGILNIEGHEIESELKKMDFIVIEKPQLDEWIAFLAKI